MQHPSLGEGTNQSDCTAADHWASQLQRGYQVIWVSVRRIDVGVHVGDRAQQMASPDRTDGKSSNVKETNLAD